jgi:homoserine dehydrogenase
VTTTVLDSAAAAAAVVLDQGCIPATCRIGLLGLGQVGAAFARLTRDAAPHQTARGFAPTVSTALVRTTTHLRAASAFTVNITSDVNAFFAEPVDVIVEALGGTDPAFALVRRALDSGIPVVTANKSLIAAHGDELSRLARRRATALRYEASCMAGVPFLGNFERRPLASRATALTAILNGTSNSILTAMARPSSPIGFDAALAEAQRLGLAEPDPTMDVSGADAAEKLAILVRLFGRLVVDPATIPLEGIGSIDAADIAAAAAFDGAIRPVAHASWNGTVVRAFVGPAFVTGAHPLARVSGVTNGIVIRGDYGVQCYTGPGAGPVVTAATLLDDVAELAAERRVRPPSPEPTRAASSVSRPDTAWFLRLTAARDSDIADLLGSYGIWCTRLARRGDLTFALICPAGYARVQSALAAVEAATRGVATAFPAISEDAAC